MVNYTGYGLSLTVDESIFLKWNGFKQSSIISTEACGVIIGGFYSKENKFLAVDCTIPMENDLRSYGSFSLLDSGHQKAVDEAYKVSDGKLIYLGTWHTHPEIEPTPSPTDINDWTKCITRNPERQLFFAIVGTQKTKIYVCVNNKFISLADNPSGV